MSILHFKSDTIEIPTYNDGYFDLYRIVQEGKFPVENLKLVVPKFPFKELSVGDKLKYELKERNIDIVLKILLSQEKSIDSLNVLKIDNKFYHVLNAYHFIDNDGYPKTRLSLENYYLKGKIL